MEKTAGETPLAQLQDQAELEKQYSVFSDEILLRWMAAVTGPHREAMAAILRRRGTLRE